MQNSSIPHYFVVKQWIIRNDKNIINLNLIKLQTLLVNSSIIFSIVFI